METAIHTAAQPPDVIALALWRMAKGKENDVIPVAYVAGELTGYSGGVKACGRLLQAIAQKSSTSKFEGTVINSLLDGLSVKSADVKMMAEQLVILSDKLGHK